MFNFILHVRFLGIKILYCFTRLCALNKREIIKNTILQLSFEMTIWHNIYEKLSYNARAEFSENVNLGICIDKSTKKIIF